MYDAIGRAAGCRRLSAAFYGRVAKDPLLRPLFPGKTFKCAIDEFAAFLVQLCGGPAEESQKRWWVSLRASHARFPLTAEHRDRWLKLMSATLAESDIDETLHRDLLAFFEH